ncbi:hypothetical protein [Methanobrevibacter sp.]|uniref:hypothetical protein n=1 Tax=Methanobrevibacter sp. TaxID=66852 RepID=UPI00386F70FB
MDENIEKYLRMLKKQRVAAIGRAADMLWIIFEDTNAACSARTISLHVQSSWRITNTEKKSIIVASLDMYFPKSSEEYTDDFEWDIQGNNLFDEKSANWLENAGDIFIDEVQMDLWGDLRLSFSNGDQMEVFVDVSDETECWRIFRKDDLNLRHMVMTGEGVYF